MTDIEKIKVLRPNFEGVKLDHNKMPIIKKSVIDTKVIDQIILTNFKNIKSIRKNDLTIVDMFNYDEVLESIWNNPLKYIAFFQNVYGVASPDFSIYPGMNKYEIEHNIYKNRWLGATWQSFGVKVIPTIAWGEEDTFDVCFSGIERGTTVIISTLGVCSNIETFIKGFNEMKKRINPSLIIVVGRLFDKMEGDFLVYELEDTFT